MQDRRPLVLAAGVALVAAIFGGILLLGGGGRPTPRADDPLPPGVPTPVAPAALEPFPLPPGARLVSAGGVVPLYAVWLVDLSYRDALAFYDGLVDDGRFTLTRLPGDDARAVRYAVRDRDAEFGDASLLAISATTPLRLSLGLAAPTKPSSKTPKYRPLGSLGADFPRGELPADLPAGIVPTDALLIATRELGGTLYAIWEGTASVTAMADALEAALEAAGRSVERVNGAAIALLFDGGEAAIEPLKGGARLSLALRVQP